MKGSVFLGRTMIKDLREAPVADILSAIRAGDRVVLARAITLLESNRPDDRKKAIDLLIAAYPFSGNSMRIGITGSPGAGKSTFIEAMGMHPVWAGKNIGVLAVDPSSRVSKGSILGDKTRMQHLSRMPNVFIRPSASGNHLGGVAAATRESIILLEAAGFDTILVETVGVGQSETDVYDITDIFILLLIPGAGDELQGIKRGIMEMADGILINKADGSNTEKAQLAKVEVERAVHLFQPKLSGIPTWVNKISATSGLGLEEVWQQIESYFQEVRSSGYQEKRRSEQREKWFKQALHDGLLQLITAHPQYTSFLSNALQDVVSGRMLPPEAISHLLEKVRLA